MGFKGQHMQSDCRAGAAELASKHVEHAPLQLRPGTTCVMGCGCALRDQSAVRLGAMPLYQEMPTSCLRVPCQKRRLCAALWRAPVSGSTAPHSHRHP